MEHAALREAVDRHLAGRSRDEAWPALGRAGVHGLLVAEALEGAGLPVSAAAPVIAALGAAGLSTPFMETSVIAATLLAKARTPDADALLRRIAGGHVIALAGLDPRLRPAVSATPTEDGWRLDGDALLVLDVAQADTILVAARTEGYAPALLTVARDSAGLLRRDYATIDGRMAADLRFIGTKATLIDSDVEEALTTAGDVALACLAVEAAAIMRRLVDDTVAYARQREQFGQPIARFQVIQHRLVDMYIHTRRAHAIAERAMAALDAHWAERARLVSAAKVTVAEAGRFVGENAVQLHGGMGMTQELPIGRLFARLTVIAQELGSADQHRLRFARMRDQQAT